MLTLTHLAGFGAGGSTGPLAMAYGGAGVQTADGSTMTVSGLSIGAADDSRRVIAAIAWNAGSNQTVSSATIGGVAATIVVQAMSTTGSAGSALLIASVPSGTTADVAVTFSGSVSRMSAATYRVVNLNSATAYATANDTEAASGEVTGSLNVPAGGFVVAVASTSDGASWSWTAGPTEDSDQYTEASLAGSSASASYASAQTPLTVTATCASGTRASLVAASWGN